MSRFNATMAATVAAGIATVGLLAGCTIATPNAGEMGQHTGMSSVASGEFSARDLMFARMMIPHHEQAIEMSDLAPSRTTTREVLDLAAEIRAAQQPEIEQMQGWLGEDDDTGMDDMDMPMSGLLSDAEMSALAAASGEEFDRLYLEGMIAHHEGAISMAQSILDSANPEVRQLGENIVESQTAEIARMRQLLQR